MVRVELLARRHPQRGAQRDRAHLAQRLPHGGQRDGEQARVFHIVNADNTHIARDADADFEQRAHELAVVEAR